jgi:Calcineurin-like phosphoesterase
MHRPFYPLRAGVFILPSARIISMTDSAVIATGALPEYEARVVASYDVLSAAFARVNIEAVGKATPLADLAAPEDEIPPPTPMELARFQAALGIALDALEPTAAEPGVLHTAQNQLASMMQTLMVERATQTGRVEATPSGALEAKFDTHDLLGWFRSLFDWWRKLDPNPFLPPPPQPDPLANEARLAMVGDWGTGMYGAPMIAQTIARLGADSRPDVMVHLGDVYYAGTPKETTKRFLNLWPSVPGVISRGCNGNHEMYSGGRGYFGQVLPTFRQSSSCWAFQNDNWLLVGLDSAYRDHDLHPGQVEWLNGLLSSASERSLILFCHHQPYSVLESGGGKLVAKLSDLLSQCRIFAWYWGHEHRCLLYDAHPQWGVLGRCIGHGGMPYFRDAGDRLATPGWWTAPSKHGVPGGQVLGGPNPYLGKDAKKYGPNGWATLEFSGPRLIESILAPDGKVLKTTQLA